MTGRQRGAAALRFARPPAIAAIPLRQSTNGRAVDILSDEARRQLGAAAELIRIPKNRLLYREDEPAEFLYCIAEGVVVTAHAAARPAPYVTTFCYARDVVGLAREGRYLESARAATSVLVFRIRLADLEAMLRQDAELAVRLLCKLCHDLGERLHHTSLLARRDALGKAAMFVEALSRRAVGQGKPAPLHLPMRRSDIANHLGLTVAALGRAFAELARRRILRFDGRRHLEIADPDGLRAVIAGRLC